MTIGPTLTTLDIEHVRCRKQQHEEVTKMPFTPMTPDEIIEVVTAFRDGKEIEYEYCREIPSEWITTTLPAWNFSDFRYRVKPAPRGDAAEIERLQVQLEAIREHCELGWRRHGVNSGCTCYSCTWWKQMRELIDGTQDDLE
jgi:hypothetical protein